MGSVEGTTINGNYNVSNKPAAKKTSDKENFLSRMGKMLDKKFDTNGDGTIDKDEMSAAILKMKLIKANLELEKTKKAMNAEITPSKPQLSN